MARVSKHGLSIRSSATWTQKPLDPAGQTSNHAPVLLWIDDFAPALTVYKATMETLGFRVLTATSGEAGLKLAAVHPLDLVITDYEMPGMNGDTVAAAVKSLKPGVPGIIFSSSTV